MSDETPTGQRKMNMKLTVDIPGYGAVEAAGSVDLLGSGSGDLLRHAATQMGDQIAEWLEDQAAKLDNEPNEDDTEGSQP